MQTNNSEDTELCSCFEELLSNCEREIVLESIFKGSRFVRVPAFGKFYVAGIAKSNKRNKNMLCFGVPVFSKKHTSKELGSKALFVPSNSNHNDGFGYYMVYKEVPSLDQNKNKCG